MNWGWVDSPAPAGYQKPHPHPSFITARYQKIIHCGMGRYGVRDAGIFGLEAAGG